MHIEEAARRADAELSRVAGAVDLLLDVSPVNATAAWEDSVRSGHGRELDLRYRPRGTDVGRLRRRLHTVGLDQIEDPTVRGLLDATAVDLEQQLALIEARETPAFLDRSLDLWGGADPALVGLARDLLLRLAPSPPPTVMVSPERFAHRCRTEIDRYRAQDPDLEATVAVRGDVPSLMVVGRELLVGTDSRIPHHRAEALVHHEVGTHLLTAHNGGRQPLTMLEHGLAGYDETQEALGVLAEHLVGGLDAERVRTLAARVLAVDGLTSGAGFPEIYRILHVDHGMDEQPAWTIAMRVVRGGGLTKDVIYLRGIVQLVAHLGSGGDLEPLLLGKAHLRHAPALGSLLGAGTLVPPALEPRWLSEGPAAARLASIRTGELPVAAWP